MCRIRYPINTTRISLHSYLGLVGRYGLLEAATPRSHHNLQGLPNVVEPWLLVKGQGLLEAGSLLEKEFADLVLFAWRFT